VPYPLAPRTLAETGPIGISEPRERCAELRPIDAAGNTCWSHSGFWGTFVLTCPQIDVTIAASWNQAMPAADFNAETVLQRAFELATAP
jgi:hypothetical protein